MHPLFFAVVLITMMQAGQPLGTATGFVYRNGTDTYLVTNLHVVAGNDSTAKPDNLRVRLHADTKSDLTLNRDLDLPLYARGSPRCRSPRH